MPSERLTVGDLKRHKGPVLAWVAVFDDDGLYLRVSKADVLRQIYASPEPRKVTGSRLSLCDGCRIQDGIFYIN